MIIAIEGIDGAGKHTLVSALRQHFDAQILTFPRYEDSIHAQLAQQALYGKMGDLINSAHGMATMFALDRHGAKDVLMAHRGTDTPVLLLDRYVASNAAYTCARVGQDAPQWVYELEFQTLGLPLPDLQILLATPPQLARERAAQREAADSARTRDAYERNKQLQDDVAAAYLQLAEDDWASPWLVSTPDTDPSSIVASIQQRLSSA